MGNKPVYDAIQVFWAAAMWWLETNNVTDTDQIATKLDTVDGTPTFADKDPGFRVRLEGMEAHTQLTHLLPLSQGCCAWYDQTPIEATRVLIRLTERCAKCGDYFIKDTPEQVCVYCDVCLQQPIDIESQEEDEDEADSVGDN